MSKEIKHHMNIHDQLYRKSRKSKSSLIGFHINSNVNSSKTKSKEPKKTLSPEETLPINLINSGILLKNFTPQSQILQNL